MAVEQTYVRFLLVCLTTLFIYKTIVITPMVVPLVMSVYRLYGIELLMTEMSFTKVIQNLCICFQLGINLRICFQC